ncbi:hypothetical protein [Paenibacillus sp. Leaf72]|uniref:hypothetical protein n=1 Tax=Paenibacillus sp. Leaf72 TaxID=1736234 RepID=UPI0006FC5E4D|nr:hypothetical protein [Paenibacillus sp. Leaf72]KQN96000.1 hypothetical protein ASF12_24505 [Paenibacillus sp. Leaf72]
MRHFLKKHYKWVAIVVVIALITETFVLLLDNNLINPNKEEAAVEMKSDSMMAADISNMTGVKAEEIIKLKDTGLSWNEVLEQLKSTKLAGNDEDRSKRSGLLAESGMDEVTSKLQAQGYQNEDILEAKMLAERLQFQLKELGGGNQPAPAVQVPTASIDKKEEDQQERYEKLLQQFNVADAVYFMLLLEDKVGSAETVLDEYLVALQLELDLNLYISDQEAYIKARDEKRMSSPSHEMITMSGIELALLEQIQKSNTRIKDNLTTTTQGTTASIDVKDSKGENILPDVPLPVVEDIRPGNPAADVMKEIEAINPNRP